jgi:hypothetical protein
MAGSEALQARWRSTVRTVMALRGTVVDRTRSTRNGLKKDARRAVAFSIAVFHGQPLIPAVAVGSVHVLVDACAVGPDGVAMVLTCGGMRVALRFLQLYWSEAPLFSLGAGLAASLLASDQVHGVSLNTVPVVRWAPEPEDERGLAPRVARFSSVGGQGADARALSPRLLLDGWKRHHAAAGAPQVRPARPRPRDGRRQAPRSPDVGDVWGMMWGMMWGI